MIDQPDRIRVWNAEASEMLAPATIQEMLSMERNVRLEGGWAVYEEHVPEDYGHLVFMRNTGIGSVTTPTGFLSGEEIFANDIVKQGYEPNLYRVEMGNDSCWIARSLRPSMLGMRLGMMKCPQIVGNIFENTELVKRGRIDGT